MSLIINITDGSSFDPLFTKYKTEDRKVIKMSAENAKEILRDMTKEESDIGKLIKEYKYENIVLNIECCSGYGINIYKENSDNEDSCDYKFITDEITTDMNKLIMHIIKNGGQVICADFSLKALISSWDKNIFGVECPLSIIGVDQGLIEVRYNPDECKDCEFTQLATVARVSNKEKDASYSKIMMKAMHNTIRYMVNPDIDPKINVKTYSIAVMHEVLREYDGPKLKRAKLYQDYKTRDIIPYEDDKRFSVISSGKGYPVHSVISFNGFSGRLIVSSQHLCNLMKIDVNGDLLRSASLSILGRERSISIERDMDKIKDNPELLEKMKTQLVIEISACSSKEKLS